MFGTSGTKKRLLGTEGGVSEAPKNPVSLRYRPDEEIEALREMILGVRRELKQGLKRFETEQTTHETAETVADDTLEGAGNKEGTNNVSGNYFTVRYGDDELDIGLRTGEWDTEDL